MLMEGFLGSILLIAISTCNFSSEAHNLPKQPPLARAVGQATQCLGLMARSGTGSCAFATVEEYLHQLCIEGAHTHTVAYSQHGNRPALLIWNLDFLNYVLGTGFRRFTWLPSSQHDANDFLTRCQEKLFSIFNLLVV